MAWRVYAASAIGTSHRKDRRPCQDAFAYRVQDEVLVAVVCDGAGSCELSHFWAQSVSETVVKTIAAQVEKQLLLPDGDE